MSCQLPPPPRCAAVQGGQLRFWAGSSSTALLCLLRRVEELPRCLGDRILGRKLAQVYTPGTVLDDTMLVRHQHSPAPGAYPAPRSLRSWRRRLRPRSCRARCMLLQDSVGGPQPLVAIYEGGNSLFGACLVDVSTATVSLCQWQEADCGRSMLSTILTQVGEGGVGCMGAPMQDARAALAPGDAGRPCCAAPGPRH